MDRQISISFLDNAQKERLGERLFLIAFGCYCFASWYFSTTFSNFLGIDYLWFKRGIYAISLICLTGKLLTQSYSVHTLFTLLAVGALLLLSGRFSGSHVLLWLFLFISASQDIGLKPCAFVLLFVLVVIGPLVIGCFAAGVIPEFTLETASRGLRHSLGFGHPNTLAAYFLCLYLCVLTLSDFKTDTFNMLTGILLLVLTVCITDSRTMSGGIALLIATPIILNLVKRDNRIRRFVSVALQIIAIAIMFASVFCMFTYNQDNPLFASLNSRLSNRPALMHGYYESKGLSLLGQPVEDADVYAEVITNGPEFDSHGKPMAFVVDNVFARLLLENGIIVGLGAIVVLLSTQNILAKRAGPAFFVFSLFLILGLAEGICLQLKINFYILYCSTLLFGNSSNMKRSILDSCFLYRKLSAPLDAHD